MKIKLELIFVTINFYRQELDFVNGMGSIFEMIANGFANE